MNYIIEKIEDIANRPIEIMEVLASLLPKRNRAGWIPVGVETLTIARQKIFFLKGSGDKSETYNQARFNTFNNDFEASYFERWIPSPEGINLYYLDRAYLSIFKVSENEEILEDDEFLYIHCDPNEVNDYHYPYKRTPHLHILRSSDDSVRHAHLAMHLHNQDELLTSKEAISSAIESSVKMITHQFLIEKAV